jgi:predicted membrane-bound spermidine synthase
MMKKRNLLLLLSFTEGGCVMATELIGAKLMAPFFGTSLYVWSAVLASTLIALAAGYFVGGVLSAQKNRIDKLLLVAFAGGLFMMTMPMSVKFAISLFGNAYILLSIVSSSIFLLMPPLFMMGCVSPLIIAELSTLNNNAGYVSGSIYALSTIGGILFTFLFGFYIIPNFGLQLPAIITGALFASVPAYIFFLKKKKNFSLLLAFILLVTIFNFYRNGVSEKVKILYTNDGMLGKLTIADFIPKDSNDISNGRMLLINNTVQTYLNFHKTKSLYFDHHQAMVDIINTLPKNKKVLQLGLGGGTLPQILFEKGYDIEVCEIDERIHQAAKKYFALNENIKVHIDDARHFINQSSGQYDVVIFDLFKGESHPSHVFTIEAFQQLKKQLYKDALILMNVHGYIEGSIAKGNRALLKTLTASGFQYHIYAQGNDPQNAERRNLLIVAAANEMIINDATQTLTIQQIKINQDFLSQDVIMQDNIPNGDLLFAEAAKKWRANSLARSVNWFGQ